MEVWPEIWIGKDIYVLYLHVLFHRFVLYFTFLTRSVLRIASIYERYLQIPNGRDCSFFRHSKQISEETAQRWMSIVRVQHHVNNHYFYFTLRFASFIIAFPFTLLPNCSFRFPRYSFLFHFFSFHYTMRSESRCALRLRYVNGFRPV
jgi:hypothetical protein